MKSILCFYHSPCNDGASSAAALTRRAALQFPDHVCECHPMGFTLQWEDLMHQEYLERLEGSAHEVSAIYVVDISLSKGKHRQIIEHLKSIGRIGDVEPPTICIDHHKSAIERMEEISSYCQDVYIRIGPGLSGATLVWYYFNERFEDIGEPPLMLRYVADQDVWEWKLPESHEVNAALNTLDGVADTFISELDWSIRETSDWLHLRTTQGATILGVIASQIERSYPRVLDVDGVDGVTYRIVNATDNASELGNQLCEESDESPNVVAIIYTVQRDWSVKCSIRSIDGGKRCAREIAELFGGGGHDNAAGCRFETLEQFIEGMSRVCGVEDIRTHVRETGMLG